MRDMISYQLARFVNVNDKIRNGQLANWDSHENNFARLKDDLLPPADRSLATLIEDLDARQADYISPSLGCCIRRFPRAITD